MPDGRIPSLQVTMDRNVSLAMLLMQIDAVSTIHSLFDKE
jgi:hypothetical protein